MVARRNLFALVIVVVAAGTATVMPGHGATSVAASDRPAPQSSPLLVDRAGHDLGPVVDSTGAITFYSPSINLLVSIDIHGSVIPFGTEFFTTPNCTGVPYFLQENGFQQPDASHFLSLMKSATGGYFKLRGPIISSLQAYSVQDIGSCDFTTTSGYAVELAPITHLPFADPIPEPVRLKG